MVVTSILGPVLTEKFGKRLANETSDSKQMLGKLVLNARPEDVRPTGTDAEVPGVNRS
jgi:hypothetical protein